MSQLSHDPVTGRPVQDDEEAVETLSDDELETELTVVSHDPVRRRLRYDRLWKELLDRRSSIRARRYGSL